MKVKKYDQFNESVYQAKLANGLTVTMLPKTGYHKTYATLTTNYGSIDNTFVPAGSTELQRFPDGIAHFLEHKMFEKADHDAFQIFGQYGASANAFTSFTKTSYLFSATRHLKENLTTLLDFVQDPYFSTATVEKEKGIIGQEIEMYDDDPSWRLYFGMIGNLYPNHPLQYDIAGTTDSIAKITADDLYAAYRTFYHPENMTLFVVGNFDPDEVLALVKANQDAKDFTAFQPIERKIPETAADGHDIIPYRTIDMPVNRAKSIVGVKGLVPIESGAAALKYRAAVNVLLELLFGDTSADYLRLYDQGIIDDTFGYDFELQNGFNFVTFSGETDDPAQFDTAIIDILENWRRSVVDQDDALALVKKEMIGRVVFMANSLEAVANRYDQRLFGTATIFDEPAVIDSLTLDYLTAVAEQLLQSQAISEYQIRPQAKN
ncbi:insulinase family protein [Lactiplantibacillus pentosus]|uniref:Zinc-dependent proteinase n=1 Tax=Lactiplantibacillus pentosus IG1 TaxID=1042160 RepID=G0M1M1_LACPE|nr:pitrilysin family protein [Lactiplantibacillus pentosus]CCC18475.1 zinc-dependent proteinase [Lactiplantibacillus pentosus IG1]MCT3284246.1 insulinase family protein [Lactiplantibacillus pentosus]MCT3303250.1 insulinase family protein [Lactiplantibacillus pentosus]PRO80640.1 insulinase family protein [Lactiplantibacillus pentosus]PRO81429.1 insulinase family protein [Lactiplantibacillus pentosus]